MNARQALAEARRRWGKGGIAYERRRLLGVDGKVIIGDHCVGRRLIGGWALEIVGTGSSWSEAFEDADRTAAREEERRRQILAERQEAVE